MLKHKSFWSLGLQEYFVYYFIYRGKNTNKASEGFVFKRWDLRLNDYSLRLFRMPPPPKYGLSLTHAVDWWIRVQVRLLNLVCCIIRFGVASFFYRLLLFLRIRGLYVVHLYTTLFMSKIGNNSYVFWTNTVGTESVQTPLNFSLFVMLQSFAKII